MNMSKMSQGYKRGFGKKKSKKVTDKKTVPQRKANATTPSPQEGMKKDDVRLD